MICPPAMDGLPETVSGYSFRISDLNVRDRLPGVSAFMRIRNGADFLELTIRSHLPYFDEIVAVYNQCTDATEQILLRLQQEVGHSKLRVIHYLDPVFPPGSEGHQSTPPDDPRSLVNYYNLALAATRFQFVTKLDDDHLAIAETTEKITRSIREGRTDPGQMLCFSGLNLFRREDGTLGIPRRDPVSGGGDIGFFRVTESTRFTHDRRFERFQRGTAVRRFAGFLYWHLKYLKADMGFGNYDLAQNPSSRYARRQAAFQSSPLTVELPELAVLRRPGALQWLQALVAEKKRIIRDRDRAIAHTFPDASVEAALLRTSAEEFRSKDILQLKPQTEQPWEWRTQKIPA